MKKILLVIGSFLLLNFFVLIFITNFHTGIALQGIAAILIIIYAIFFNKVKRRIHIAIISVCMIPLIFITALAVYGNSDNADYSEDAVIVLGSGIKGAEVSTKLARRLDAAVAYHGKNPEAIIIVCGGKGAQEDITEALAMERYLIAAGVPEESIIKEDKSTSTYENILFAGEILNENLPQGFSSVIITSDYHVYRAVKTAHFIGFPALHISTKTDWYSAAADYLREMLAVIDLWVIPR